MKIQTSVITGSAVDEIPALAKEPMKVVMRGTAKMLPMSNKKMSSPCAAGTWIMKKVPTRTPT